MRNYSADLYDSGITFWLASQFIHVFCIFCHLLVHFCAFAWPNKTHINLLFCLLSLTITSVDGFEWAETHNEGPLSVSLYVKRGHLFSLM